MSESTPLTLVFHIVDGRQLRYEQPDSNLAGEIVRDLKRRRIFDQPVLSICGNSSVTGLATRSIVKIDFLNAENGAWPKTGARSTSSASTPKGVGRRSLASAARRSSKAGASAPASLSATSRAEPRAAVPAALIVSPARSQMSRTTSACAG